MSDQNPDYADIRRKVEKGVARQKWTYRLIFFVMHLIFYVVSMLIMWGSVATDAQLGRALFDGEASAAASIILPSILWSAVLLFHIASLYTESSAGEKAMRERLLMREIGEEILRKGLADEEIQEKPKRHAEGLEIERARLSDDGELLLLDEDERLEQNSYGARTNPIGSSK